MTQTENSTYRDSGGALHAHKNEPQAAHTRHLKGWNPAHIDLRLAPVACTDVYSQLVLKRQPLALLADTGGNAATVLKTTPGALQTRHTGEHLQRTAQKLQRETSDQNHARYRLYLVAGFALTARTDEMHRIPLLLIPVELQTSEAQISLIYRGEQLHLNPYIVDACDGSVERQLPAFERVSELRDYLRSLNRHLHQSLQCRISANTGLLSLQADELKTLSIEERFEQELDANKPGQRFRPMPPLPACFDPTLASTLLRHIPAAELPEALFDFSHQYSPQTSSVRTDLLATLADNYIHEATLHSLLSEKLISCCGWLREVGLGQWSLNGLSDLAERVQRLRAAVSRMQANPALAHYFRPEEMTVGLLQSVYRLDNDIINAPSDLHQHAISLHVEADTRVLLQQIKVTAATLEADLEALQQTFHMSEIPSADVLQRLIDTIAAREHEPQLTNPLYFKARKRLNDILKTQSGLITEADLRRLQSLANTLKQSELFASDLYNKRCLGTLYKGVHTNWQRIDNLVDSARGLAQQLDSTAIAGRLLERWPSFTRDYQTVRDDVRDAAVAAWQLEQLVPQFITANTPLSAALRSAEKYQQRIVAWSGFMTQKVSTVGNAGLALTPNQLLSLANIELGDGGGEVRLPQGQHAQQILREIVSRGIDIETLDGTANWLLLAMHRLDIDLSSVRRFLDAEVRLPREDTFAIAI